MDRWTPTYILLHVVGHVGQFIGAISHGLLHIQHNHASVRVVLQNHTQICLLVTCPSLHLYSPPPILSYLDFLHQVFVEVVVSLVNGFSDGTGIKRDKLTNQ